MKTRQKSMLDGPLLPAILSYWLPITLTNFLQLAFHSADMVIVGQYCGTTSFAAVSATGQISNMIIGLFSGLSIGVGVSAAHAFGSGDGTDLHRTVHTAVPTAMLFGLILMLVGFVIAEPFLELLDTPESVMPLATMYLKIFVASMPFSMVYNYCAAVLRASGDTKSPMIFLGISGVLNVLLNILLVTIIPLDVAGVAIATVISTACSAILVVVVLMRRKDACRLQLNKLHIYKPQLLKIFRIGFPASIQSLMYSIANLFIQSSINSFGEAFISGSAASMNIESYVFHSVTGFSQASVDFVGQNYGAKQFKRIKKITAVCLSCVAIVGASFGLLAILFRYPLLKLFVPDSQEAIEYGMIRVAAVASTYFLCAMVDVSTGTMRGMGESTLPMLVSILGICAVRVVWLRTVFQIPQYHTPLCLFLCFPISWVVTFFIQFVLLFFVFKRKSVLHS